jgi:hypothetical protein
MFAHVYVLPNIAHIGQEIQQFFGIEPWERKSKNLVHQPHKILEN